MSLPGYDKFVNEIVDVCKKYKLSFLHEYSEGTFVSVAKIKFKYNGKSLRIIDMNYQDRDN